MAQASSSEVLYALPCTFFSRSVGLFCADQRGRQWFVNIAMETFGGGAVMDEDEKFSKIAIEIPKTPWGQKAALAEGSMVEKECEDENDEDCLKLRILDPQTIEMAEVSFWNEMATEEIR